MATRPWRAPVVGRPVALCVVACGVEHQCERRQDGLDQHKLQRHLLCVAHEAAVDWLRRHAARARRPRGQQHKAVHLDLHGARAAHVGQAQRHEVVDHPGLIAGAEQSKAGMLQGHLARCPHSVCAVYGR